MAKIDDRVIQAPYAISILRILLAPAFFCAFMWDFTEMAIILYIAAFASDILDGQLERRQKTASSSALEAYLDPTADFVLVLMSFCAFSLKQIYPAWILVVFVFMFLFFTASSDRRRPLYDPVGKYYGTFLIVTIGVTLFFPTGPASSGVLVLIVAYTLGLVIYRTVFLWKNRTRAQSSLGG